MSEVFILLGGNQKKTKEIFSRLLTDLEEEVGQIIKKSSLFLTEPWGFDDDNPFLNQVIQINTAIRPDEILLKTSELETKYGRIRGKKPYGSRSIDIDILFYDTHIVQNRNLIIPHPRMHLRKFTLVPLNEIAPDMIHPKLNKTIFELLQSCEDKSWVRKLTE